MSNPAGQRWDPEQYSRNAAFVPQLGEPVIDLLAPRPGERILDLGCGDGALTQRLIDLGCEVVGVDASPDMVAAARRRGLGDARVVDGEALGFNEEFDAVFTNAALHWMKQPDRVIAGVWRALRCGGRFVGEFGGAGNVAAIVGALESACRRRGIGPAALNPWYFPTAEEYGERLKARGFEVKSIDLFPRPTPLPDDVRGWLATFAGAFTAAIPAAEHAAFLDEVAERCAPALRGPDGRWIADYVRLRFAAIKP